jgi:hypothetical protein
MSIERGGPGLVAYPAMKARAGKAIGASPSVGAPGQPSARVPEATTDRRGSRPHADSGVGLAAGIGGRSERRVRRPYTHGPAPRLDRFRPATCAAPDTYAY